MVTEEKKYLQKQTKDHHKYSIGLSLNEAAFFLICGSHYNMGLKHKI